MFRAPAYQTRMSDELSFMLPLAAPQGADVTTDCAKHASRLIVSDLQLPGFHL
jgi:hypothetical protein